MTPSHHVSWLYGGKIFERQAEIRPCIVLYKQVKDLRKLSERSKMKIIIERFNIIMAEGLTKEKQRT